MDTSFLRKHVKAIVISSIIIAIAFMTNYPQYAIMTAWCGRQPITGTRFGAAYSYSKPGDPYYGAGLFMEYYCTEQDAQSAGLQYSDVH